MKRPHFRPFSAAALDPLAWLDDGFTNSPLESDWTIYEGDGTVTQSIAGGELNVTVNAGGAADAFWFDGEQGCLIYKTITGNFDMRAQCRVRNLADSGLPTVGDGNFRIAGLAAHDPDRATNLDYVHIGFGCTASAAVTCEWKTTVASVSTYGAVAAPTGVGELRIRRVGQQFDVYLDGALVQGIDRTAAPLPNTLQVGIMPPYSNVAGHDLRLFVDSITFRTP